MKFDVVLRYPDYAAEDWPTDMYVAQNVEAKDYRHAIYLAQHEAYEALTSDLDDDPNGSPTDFAMVLVLPGNTKIFARGDLPY